MSHSFGCYDTQSVPYSVPSFLKFSLLTGVEPLTVVTPLSVPTTVKVNEKPLSVVITVICITS